MVKKTPGKRPASVRPNSKKSVASAKAPAKKRKRIGVFVGAFDMIHYGHLICAERARQELDLDTVLFVVNGDSPNKVSKNPGEPGQGMLDAEDRYDMVVAATEDNPYFEASRLDIEQGGGGLSVLAVQAAINKYGPDCDYYYLSSAEYLNPEHKYYLPKWVGGKELFKICTFLIFPRDKHDVKQAQAWAKLIPQAKIVVMDAPSPALSSTLIKSMVEQGKSIWYTTVWAVQQMIAKKGHYRLPTTPPLRYEPVPPEEIRAIGIYGGQFDPIHFGNLLFAEWTRQQYNLDRVVFVPSGRPLNNPSGAQTAEARYRAVVAATAENPFFDVSRADMDRHTASYALLTVQEMRKKFGKDVQLNLLISSDYLNPSHEYYLPEWMGSEELFSMVRFLVFCQDPSEMEQVNDWAKLVTGANIEVITAPSIPVTSANIRDMVCAGQSTRYTMPNIVQQSIAKTGLYKGMKRGLVVGTFAPPHVGDVYLLEFAQSSVDELWIGVESSDVDTLPLELRLKWLKEMFPSARVFPVDGIAAAEAADTASGWRTLAAQLKKVLPGQPNYLISAKDYGRRLAKAVGAHFIPGDWQYSLIKASEAELRSNPMAHWEQLPRCVQPHFVRRVCIIGPESTGKSTLANNLAKHFHSVAVTEYARAYLATRGDRVLEADLPYFARGQAASEDALAHNANRVLFCDSNAITTLIWSDWLYGKCDPALLKLADERDYDLYLLADVDVPWVQDGQRYLPTDRDKFRDRCIEELNSRRIPFVTIKGDWDKRLADAIAAVEKICSAQSAVTAVV